MDFDVEIVLRERNHAVTERVVLPALSDGVSPPWTDQEVEQVLKAILLAIDRAKSPSAEQRYVALRGFSWIVEPNTPGTVVIAIEIPSGAAVAGPFQADQAVLDRTITRVLAAAAPVKPVVH